ncbi:ribonuclease H-like domain-containing protein [Candidatus Roizmanbacteria bacterium]|nr:ribonuclease H-like domain-containing protein [Candidatus Roizmanbacteria bacterium]
MKTQQKLPVVLDVETKHTFRDYTSHKKLGISVGAVYDYAKGQSEVFLEEELNTLFRILENASYIIGYNVNNFDIPVLQAYYPGDLSRLPAFDILDEIKEKIGKRLALNDVLYATFGKRKTGHGLDAVNLYKEGKLDELKRYCLDDVALTRELFDYGVEHGKIFYLNAVKKVEIPVSWKKYLESPKKTDTALTLPF